MLASEAPILSPHLSPRSCFVPEWLYIGLPAGDKFVPEGTKRGQMPGNRMASGFGRYVKEEGCRRLSPHVHILSPLICPRPYMTGDKCPETAGHRAPAALWEIREGRGHRKLFPPWLPFCTRTPILSPQICPRIPILSPALHDRGQMPGSRIASGSVTL